MERGILCGDNIKESGDKGQGKPCWQGGTETRYKGTNKFGDSR